MDWIGLDWLAAANREHLWLETRKPDMAFEEHDISNCSLRIIEFDDKANTFKSQVRQEK